MPGETTRRDKRSLQTCLIYTANKVVFHIGLVVHYVHCSPIPLFLAELQETVLLI